MFQMAFSYMIRILLGGRFQANFVGVIVLYDASKLALTSCHMVDVIYSLDVMQQTYASSW
jgi:hypothetical protein